MRDESFPFKRMDLVFRRRNDNNISPELREQLIRDEWEREIKRSAEEFRQEVRVIVNGTKDKTPEG